MGNEINPSRRVQIAYLRANKALTKVLSKYADFADVFSLKLIIKLSKHMKINDHAIELIDNWQPLYGLIYSLRPIKLKILKIYIKFNLANDFIKPYKFFTRTPIFFNKKLDKSLRLCIDYQDFNNLIIKN